MILPGTETLANFGSCHDGKFVYLTNWSISKTSKNVDRIFFWQDFTTRDFQYDRVSLKNILKWNGVSESYLFYKMRRSVPRRIGGIDDRSRCVWNRDHFDRRRAIDIPQLRNSNCSGSVSTVSSKFLWRFQATLPFTSMFETRNVKMFTGGNILRKNSGCKYAAAFGSRSIDDGMQGTGKLHSGVKSRIPRPNSPAVPGLFSAVFVHQAIVGAVSFVGGSLQGIHSCLPFQFYVDSRYLILLKNVGLRNFWCYFW